MRISEIKNHIGGKVMRTFNYEVNHYSRFLTLDFDVKPSKKAIEFIEANGCNIKEVNWAEVSETGRIISTKWEVCPNDIAEYEFMGFWEESGVVYKNNVISGSIEMSDEWLTIDEFKEKVTEICSQYNTEEYDLNYNDNSTRNWFYRDWREFEQNHLSARYWAGIELRYRYIRTEYQEGKRPRIEFDRSVY